MRTYGLLSAVLLLTTALLGVAACGRENPPASSEGRAEPTSSAASTPTPTPTTPTAAGPADTPRPSDPPAEAADGASAGQGGSDAAFTPPSDWCGTGRMMGRPSLPMSAGTLVLFRQRDGRVIWVPEKDLTPARRKELAAEGWTATGSRVSGLTGR